MIKTIVRIRAAATICLQGAEGKQNPQLCEPVTGRNTLLRNGFSVIMQSFPKSGEIFCNSQNKN